MTLDFLSEASRRTTIKEQCEVGRALGSSREKEAAGFPADDLEMTVLDGRIRFRKSQVVARKLWRAIDLA